MDHPNLSRHSKAWMFSDSIVQIYTKVTFQSHLFLFPALLFSLQIKQGIANCILYCTSYKLFRTFKFVFTKYGAVQVTVHIPIVWIMFIQSMVGNNTYSCKIYHRSFSFSILFNFSFSPNRTFLNFQILHLCCSHCIVWKIHPARARFHSVLTLYCSESLAHLPGSPIIFCLYYTCLPES